MIVQIALRTPNTMVNEIIFQGMNRIIWKQFVIIDEWAQMI